MLSVFSSCCMHGRRLVVSLDEIGLRFCVVSVVVYRARLPGAAVRQRSRPGAGTRQRAGHEYESYILDHPAHSAVCRDTYKSDCRFAADAPDGADTLYRTVHHM